MMTQLRNAYESGASIRSLVATSGKSYGSVHSMLVQSGAPVAGPAVTLSGMAANLAFVIAGNLFGGAVLVGLSYHFIHRSGGRSQASPALERDRPARRPAP